MLDDHILKAQTMHSSAYIKPFEEEMKEWEDKLISMQVDRGHLSVQQCDISVILRIFWMPGWGARSPGSTSSPSSTARTSWSRCLLRGGSSTRWTSIENYIPKICNSTFSHQVDRIWRNIMAKTVSDTRVLQATSQPNMLVSSQFVIRRIWFIPLIPFWKQFFFSS